MRVSPRAALLALAAAAALAATLAAGLLATTHRTQPEPTGGAVRILRGGTEAEISGPLAQALVAPLEAALAAGARTVQLDSPGGSQDAARRLAQSIRAAGVDTAVTDRCLSACLAPFMAGRQRWIGPFAQLAMESEAGGASLLALYREAGLPPRLLPAIATTPAGQGWFPGTEDLVASGTATAIAQPTQFALAGFGPAPTPETIAARLATIPAYQTIATADPAGWTRDLALWTETVLQGRPGDAAFDQTRQHLATLFQAALPNAPDTLLLDHARLFLEELAWMQRHEPDSCPGWAASQSGLPGPADEDLAQRRGTLRLAIIAAAPGTSALPRAPEDCLQLQRTWEHALAQPTQAAAVRVLLQPAQLGR